MGAQSTLTILIQKILAALPRTLRSNGYSMWPVMCRTQGELDFAKENSKLVTFKVKYRNLNEYLENHFLISDSVSDWRTHFVVAIAMKSSH